MKFITLLPALLLSSVSASNLFQQLASGGRDLTAESDPSRKVPGSNPLEFCGPHDAPANNLLTIESVNLLPNPPEVGKTLTIEATGVLHDVIAKGAKVYVTAKYGLITLVRETIDLCEHVDEVDLECPIDQGKLVLTKSVDIPAQVPPGTYTVSANVETVDGRLITCLTAVVTFPVMAGK